MSRHAERGRRDLLCRELSLGLRLVITIGFPASLGLIVLANPLAVLLFQRGAFDIQDAQQTGTMIACYGVAVWAYCGLLIMHRGYYAVGDRLTPLRVGLVAILFNIVVNLTLIWPLGGAGLALGTAATAIGQFAAVTVLSRERIGKLEWASIFQVTGRGLVATAVMGGRLLFHARSRPKTLCWFRQFIE